MNPVLSRLRARLGAASVESCNKDNCSLGLDGLDQDNRVIMDCDRYPPVRDRLRCDYVLLYDDGQVHSAPVEFKSKNTRTTEAVGQLQAGARLAETLMRSQDARDCVPILLHRGMRRQEINMLKRRRPKIEFRGSKFPVNLGRCGDPITKFVRG